MSDGGGGMSSSIQQLCGTARPRRGSATSVGSFDMSTSASKRSRGGSISGRLRTASDLEDLGWIDKSQKGHIKDLIISGDPVLRSALDKYEAGDKGELEVLIKQGALTGRRHSLAGLDLLDGLDLDFLNVKYHTDHGGMGGGGGNGGGGGGGGGDGHYDAAHDAAFSAATFDDFFGPFPETDMALGGDGIDSSGKHGGGGGGARVSYPRANSLLGTFDFTDRTSERLSERADGGGGGGGGGGSFSSLFSTSSHYTRRNSLTSGLLGPGGAEEVPLSAYESLAASLQQQKPTGRRPGRAAAPAKASHHAPKNPRGVRGTARAAKATYAEEDEEEEEEDDDDEDYDDRPATQHRGGRGRRAAGQSQQTQYPQPRKTGLRGLAKNSSSSQGVPEPTRLAAATLSSGIYNPALGGERPAGWLGYYSPQERRERIARFLAKRDRRVWTKKVKYDVRKNFADSRVRVKGRFVKKEDEEAMRELVSF